MVVWLQPVKESAVEDSAAHNVGVDSSDDGEEEVVIVHTVANERTVKDNVVEDVVVKDAAEQLVVVDTEVAEDIAVEDVAVEDIAVEMEFSRRRSSCKWSA